MEAFGSMWTMWELKQVVPLFKYFHSPNESLYSPFLPLSFHTVVYFASVLRTRKALSLLVDLCDCWDIVLSIYPNALAESSKKVSWWWKYLSWSSEQRILLRAHLKYLEFKPNSEVRLRKNIYCVDLPHLYLAFDPDWVIKIDIYLRVLKA